MNWDKLIEIFLEKNKQINLSAIRDADGVLVKHIYDSIELDKVLTLKKGHTVCDVGTGGGFPLLPLAMSHPDVSFIGIDSVGKKVRAVNDMIDQLELKNVKAIPLRAEEYKTQFSVVTARAVAYATKLLPQVAQLVKKGGYLVLFKQFSEEEKKDLMSLVTKFKLKLETQHTYKLFDDDVERVIYVLKKYL